MKNFTLCGIIKQYTSRVLVTCVIALFLGTSTSLAQANAAIGSPLDLSDSPITDIQIGTVFKIVFGVEADGAQSVDGVQFQILYDNTLLQVNSAISVAPADLETALLNPDSPDTSTSGEVNYAKGSLVDPDPAGNFNFVEVQFEALANGLAALSFGGDTDITFGGVSILGTTGTANIQIGTPAPFELCIASGSASALSPSDGRTYEADVNAAQHSTRTGGTDFDTTENIGTLTGDDLTLYQTEVYGVYSYDIPVTNNGIYKVELFMAEIYIGTSAAGAPPAEPGRRVFDVLVEGNLVLDEFDMLDPSKGGVATTLTDIQKTYYVNVTDNTLNILVPAATVDNGKLSGVCVTEVPTGGNVSPDPNIANITDAEEGVAGAWDVTITDPDSGSLNVTINGLPAGLSYNSGTGQIEGTPDVGTNGTYDLYALVNDGVSSDVTQQFSLTIAEGTLSTEEFDLGNFKLYPNPAHRTEKYITLEIAQGQGVIKDINIYDMGGRLIESRDLENLNTNKETIEVQAYARGMYFLDVISSLGKKATAKFYVQ